MDDFDDLLRQATSRIDDRYFMLPVAGSNSPIYRERVYCYELYHQLRCAWPNNTPYLLGGEVDKAGHPLLRQNDLDTLKPDLLVHAPGVMDNYAIIEVKPINGRRDGIVKDLATLHAFRTRAEYRRGILLIYGSTYDDELIEIANDELSRYDGAGIEIWRHRAAGSVAEHVA